MFSLELNNYFPEKDKLIDFEIGAVTEDGNRTNIQLARNGTMPMPVDVAVTDDKGRTVIYHIPLRIMRGAKAMETDKKREWKVVEDWPWTHPGYTLNIKLPKDRIARIEIDPSGRLADLNRTNNGFPKVKS